ncbi:Regulator of Vps4 activity in the MVB pathway protein [Euphorbia peplus]|nr:Regulator of Vps4 activity in the MVB pathway protein [Euphorbia peplus]
MAVAGAAASNWKKLMKLTLSGFGLGFNSSKCKTAAKMAVARIKLLRNKRQVVVRQMRRDIALLLESRQDATARIRVEHVIREQNVLAANEFIELFCELVVSRLTIISKRRECPEDLKEGIASLIFAAPRCSEIPELAALVKIFEKKYGKDFVSAATDLRPNAGVNRMLIDKLSVRTPSGEVKLKVMKEIAKEYQIDWDTTESEKELLKAPEERIEGPNNFVSASSAPVKRTPNDAAEMNKQTIRSSNERATQFENTSSAAEAAAECAKQAIAAAQAAAYLANRDSNQAPPQLGSGINNHGFGTPSPNSVNYQANSPGTMHKDYSGSHYTSSEEATTMQMDDDEEIYRRHSYNVTRPVQTDTRNANRRHSYNSNIKFDESDCDEEIEMEESPTRANPPPPPTRPAPRVPSPHAVHPKLPDYDELSARFEALKYQKSKK